MGPKTALDETEDPFENPIRSDFGLLAHGAEHTAHHFYHRPQARRRRFEGT